MSAPHNGLTALAEASALAVRTFEGIEVVDQSVATPCTAWDLGQLLEHLEDSLAAIEEALTSGSLNLLPATTGAQTHARAAANVTRRAARLHAWSEQMIQARGLVRIQDAHLDAETLAAVGALEIAVHTWDVSQAVEQPLQIPSQLAHYLHAVAVRVIAPEDRLTRFGPAIAVSPGASPSDLLLAFLGRRRPPM